MIPVDPNADPFGAYAETPQQEYDRFYRAYHSADRDAVLQGMRAKMGAPNGGAIQPSDPATGNAAAPGAPPGGYADPAEFGRQWIASGGRTVQDLQNFVTQHPEFGAELFGSKGDKLKFPNGNQYDGVLSAGAGGLGATFNPIGPGGADGNAMGDFGSLAQRWGKEFHAPTQEELMNDPAYKFQLSEGIHALDSSAAARGTLLSGGQEKDIMTFATGLANQSAQQRYTNALGEYMNSYNIFRNDNNDIFGRYDRIADRGANAANNATS